MQILEQGTICVIHCGEAAGSLVPARAARHHMAPRPQASQRQNKQVKKSRPEKPAARTNRFFFSHDICTQAQRASSVLLWASAKLFESGARCYPKPVKKGRRWSGAGKLKTDGPTRRCVHLQCLIFLNGVLVVCLPHSALFRDPRLSGAPRG